MSSATHIQTLLPNPNSPFAAFGSAVDILGNTAVVGAPGSQSVYMFQYDTNTSSWVQFQTVMGPPNFGQHLSLPTTRLLAVCSPQTKEVYVYRRPFDTSLWTQEAVLTPDDNPTQFGYSVDALSTSSDTIVVGSTGGGLGRVYVFVKQSPGWALQYKIDAPGSVPEDFSARVAIDGRPGIWVGAPAADSAKGAVYYYQLSSGVPILSQRLTVANGAAGDQFGAAIASRGGLVGAPGFDEGSALESGTVYSVYGLPGSFNTSRFSFIPNEIKPGAKAGFSVGRWFRSFTILGAPYLSGTPLTTNAGAAFYKEAPEPMAVGLLPPTGEIEANANFGFAVQVGGNAGVNPTSAVAIIGAPYKDSQGFGSNSGAAYLYRLVP